MQISSSFDETISNIESASHRVLFKDLHAKGALEGDAVVNHRPTEASSVEGWIKKQAADLISDKRNKASGFSIMFEHPGIRVRQKNSAYVFRFLREKAFAEKWMGERTCRSPH